MMKNNSKVAIIDMGSNTIKVLVASRNRISSELEALYTSTKEARISQGIGLADEMFLAQESMERGLGAVKELLSEIEEYQPEEIKIVATSAVRDAGNKEEYKDLIFEETGFPLDVLTGDEEAQGIADGILCDPSVSNKDDFFIMDMGGGSLEVIEVINRRAVQYVSLPLGAVRVREQFLDNPRQPLSETEKKSLRDHAKICFLEEGLVNYNKKPLLIGAGGSFTIARAILAERAGVAFDDFTSQIMLADFSNLTYEMAAKNFTQRIENPFIPENRADIFPAALITLLEMCDLLGTGEIIHSSYTLRYGLASRLLQ